MNQKETIFILTKSDYDRIDASIKLLQQIVREIVITRRTRIARESQTPGALYELAEEFRSIRENEQLQFSDL